MRKRELHAELVTDNDGNFISYPTNFSIINNKDKTFYQEEQFQRELNSRNFELSLIDNRLIKLQIYDASSKRYIEYSIVFSNVHKKNQFAELYNIEELSPNKLARRPGVLSEELLKAALEPAKVS